MAELKPGRLSDVDFCCLFCFLPAMWTRELGRHGFQRERRIRNSCIKEQTGDEDRVLLTVKSMALAFPDSKIHFVLCFF